MGADPDVYFNELCILIARGCHKKQLYTKLANSHTGCRHMRGSALTGLFECFSCFFVCFPHSALNVSCISMLDVPPFLQSYLATLPAAAQ